MNNIRVIVVEDDNDLRSLIAEELARNSMQVSEATTVVEYFQQLTEKTFDVVVLDVGLPDHSGFSILEHIRKSAASSQTGVIILTAKGGSEDRVNGYRLGADLYMVKPVDTKELVFAIRNLAARLTVPGISEGAGTEEWLLDKASWVLRAPNGSQCDLSSKEMELIQLLHSCGGVANKYDLGSALGYRGDEHGKRALESVILRFRRKLATTGNANMPIKTVHGVGYAFTGTLTVL